MDASKVDIAALRAEIVALRAEVARIGQTGSGRIDDLSLVISGGLVFVVAAMLVGLALGRAA